MRSKDVCPPHAGDASVTGTRRGRGQRHGRVQIRGLGLEHRKMTIRGEGGSAAGAILVRGGADGAAAHGAAAAAGALLTGVVTAEASASPVGEDLIDDIRSQIDPPGGPSPPAGATVRLAGLPVLAAEANTDLSHSRWWLPLAGLLAVGIVLAAIYRSVRRAVIPLIPVLMATGWSGLVVAALGISLNPMSATLGALVIAIATEFSVILSARYANERRAGLPVGEALRRTYLRTGAAVLASGITAIAGFAVLAIAGLPLLDDIGLISVAPVLRDFGLITVADLLVALAGVMLVLPAAVVWAEDGFRVPWRARSAPLAAGESPS